MTDLEVSSGGLPLSALDQIDAATGKPFSQERSGPAKTNGGPAARARKPHTPKKAVVADYRVIERDLARVKPKAIDWLYPRYFPRGMVSCIHAAPGAGKSGISLDFAAKASQGDPMPDGATVDPVFTHLMVRDDPLEEVILPRLIAAGAERSLIMTLDKLQPVDAEGQDFGPCRHIDLFEDLKFVRRQLIERSTGLLIIDPLMAFFGGDRDANSTSQMADAIYKLGEMAAETGCAVVLVHWDRKDTTGKRVSRMLGSVSLEGVIRAAYAIDRHPTDPDSMVMVCSKMNIAPKPLALVFRVEGAAIEGADGQPIATSRIEWLGAEDIKPEDFPTTERAGSKLPEVREWLAGVLSGGAQTSEKIRADGKTLGYSERTITRAREKMGLTVTREAEFGASTCWRLPTKGEAVDS